MGELQFLTVTDVMALHEQVMDSTNQESTSLVRPEALESAVQSARNLAWYENAGAAEISAHLAIHIALAHPWVDGNKRTAAIAGILTARLNGARQADSQEALTYGQLLIRYVESSSQERQNVLSEFVTFINRWFD